VLVLDASAVIEVLFRTKVGTKVAEVIFEPKINLVAPELLPVETIQVIRRYIYSKELSIPRASVAFKDLQDLPIAYYSYQILMNRIWELKNNFSAYDATYIALAECLESPLLTCDSAFQKGSGRLHKAKIVVLKS